MKAIKTKSDALDDLYHQRSMAEDRVRNACIEMQHAETELNTAQDKLDSVERQIEELEAEID